MEVLSMTDTGAASKFLDDAMSAKDVLWKNIYEEFQTFDFILKKLSDWQGASVRGQRNVESLGKNVSKLYDNIKSTDALLVGCINYANEILNENN